MIAYEFQSGNLKQGVIHGLTRIELLLGKVILVCTLGLYSSVLIFLTGLILGFWHTEDILLADIYKSSGFFFLSLLNIILYLSLAVMIAFLTKNTASAIILLILIWFPGDWIIGLLIPESIQWLENFRPMEVIDELIPLKEFVAKNSLLDMATNTYYKSREVELWQLCMACFAYITIYWLIIYKCIRKDM
jgi:ABC-type transport system involved in multi-copper enzyme maturation permease subunit